MAADRSSEETFKRALAALRAGQAADAASLFKAVLQRQPRHVAALNLLGIALMRLERFGEAETYLRRALQEQANSDATLYNYGIVLKALQRPAQALDCFSRALALNPGIAETWNNRGATLNDLKRYREALADFDKALAIDARYAPAFVNKGQSLAALGLYEQSLAAYDRALQLDPHLIEARLGRAHALAGVGRRDVALSAFDSVLALEPAPAKHWRAKAMAGRGTVLAKQRRYEAAAEAFEQALTAVPDLAEAWLGRGNVLLARRQYADAAAAYDKALAIDSEFAEALVGRGNVLTEFKRYEDALAEFDRALTLKPELPEALLGRGNVLAQLRHYPSAAAAYDKALALRADFAEAWIGHGNLFADLKLHERALAAYEQAIAHRPDLADAWNNRGHVLILLNRYDEAYAAYDRAFAIDPELKQLAGSRLYAKLFLCDWRGLDDDVAHLLAAVRSGRFVSPPFPLLALPATLADQLQCARTATADLPVFAPLAVGKDRGHERLRIAYLSSDFRDHPIAHLTAGLFEAHDRSRFDVTAISYGAEEPASRVRRRIEAACAYFVDARLKPDDEIAALLAAREIDIAIDLNGMTDGRRPNILARRPAPVQVSYLGYAGTMGAAYIDYVVADRTVVPEEHFAFFSEKVVWLPDSFMVADNRRPIAERAPTRSECALPETGFVFCSFNNSFKIAPDLFKLWMRLLLAVPGSVLWLSGHAPAIVANLRREAQACGVEPERLVFAPRVGAMDDHLARHACADLFLDTLPYNAHATASDALWAGLPVLTCLGATFAGRVAASLNRAVGLGELVTHSLEEYEALALTIAREPARLAALKAKLAANRTTHPLFDTARFTRNIEAAYLTMWQRHRAGEPPAAFAVEPPMQSASAPAQA